MVDEGVVAGLDGGSVADLIAATHARSVQAETDLLVLAGVWGHRAELDAEQLRARADVRGGRVPSAARQPGGEGTPRVDGDAVIEFGTLTHTTTQSAAGRIGDALDLEHRLPRLWARVRHGEVVAWQARKIARATRHLSAAAAGYVDAAIVDYAASLPWGRLQALVEAKVIEADPAAAQARAAAADADRFVRTGRTCEQGLRTIFARVDAGDAIWFVAMVDRIAAILAAGGDPDPVQVRRSKAIGILADPAYAAVLIASHGAGRLDGRASGRTDPPGGVPAGGGSCDGTAGSAGGCVGDPTPVERAEPPGVPLGEGGSAPFPHRPGPGEDAAGRPGSRSAPPDRERAWPVSDPWDRHRWIPDQQWQAAHCRHRDDPGPDEPTTAPPGQTAPPGPAGLPGIETGPGRSGDPARAGTTLARLLDDSALRRRLAPTAVVYLHLSADALPGQLGPVGQPGRRGQPGRVARMEGAGPVTIGQVRRFLGTGRVNVVIKPVIDLNGRPPAADAWEIPAHIRERTRLRMPAEVFPWAASTSTSPDLDHTIPYLPSARGGPPGQTTETRLGPLGRAQHNAKTRGRWRVRQPVPGVFVWRSPHGQTLIVDPDGSHDYGRGTFATRLWHAALNSTDTDQPGPPARSAGRVDVCYPRAIVEVTRHAA